MNITSLLQKKANGLWYLNIEDDLGATTTIPISTGAATALIENHYLEQDVSSYIVDYYHYVKTN